MKYIAAIVLTVIMGSSMSQTSGLLWRYDKQVEDCGTWVKDSMRYTDWVTVDTIATDAMKVILRITQTEKRDWVYDKERQVRDIVTYDTWYPCGFEPGEKWRQYRICKFTGIKQERYRVQDHKYIPPPVSAYQRLEDSLLIKSGRKHKLLFSSDGFADIGGDSTVIHNLIIKPSVGTTLEYKLHN